MGSTTGISGRRSLVTAGDPQMSAPRNLYWGWISFSEINVQPLVKRMPARLPRVFSSRRGKGWKSSPRRVSRLSQHPPVSHKAPHLPLICLEPLIYSLSGSLLPEHISSILQQGGRRGPPICSGLQRKAQNQISMPISISSPILSHLPLTTAFKGTFTSTFPTFPGFCHLSRVTSAVVRSPHSLSLCRQ